VRSETKSSTLVMLLLGGGRGGLDLRYLDQLIPGSYSVYDVIIKVV
jgi:hypothetical protein